MLWSIRIYWELLFMRQLDRCLAVGSLCIFRNGVEVSLLCAYAWVCRASNTSIVLFFADGEFLNLLGDTAQRVRRSACGHDSLQCKKIAKEEWLRQGFVNRERHRELYTYSYQPHRC